MSRHAVSYHLRAIIRRVIDAAPIGRFAYLAGGTGLALHFGHRISIDADLFVEQPFYEEAVALWCSRNGQVISVEQGTIHARIDGIKISMFLYPYPLISPLVHIDAIPVAGVDDIACMKTLAIAQRAEKKDFYDMYEVFQRGMSPQRLKELIIQKYGANRINCYHILRSFFYFDDVERSLDPEGTNVSWPTVKAWFTEQEKRLAQDLLC